MMAYELASAYVSVIAQTKGVGRQIQRDFGQQADAAGVSAGRTSGKKFGGAFLGVAKKAGAIGAAIAVGMAAKGGISRALNIETAQAKLKGLGNDSKTVTKIMDNALASVAGTSFGLGEAATTAAGAVAAGIKPGKGLERMLKSVANSAASAGVGMDEMGSIYNKVATSGKAQNDVLAQVADKGIPIYQALGKQFGVTGDEVFKMAKKGEIGFNDFEKAMTAASGTVAKEIGGTFLGTMSNAKAAFSRIGATVMTPFLEVIKGGANALIPILDGLNAKLKPIFGTIATGFQEMKRSFSDGEAPKFDSKIVTALAAVGAATGKAVREVKGGVTAMVAAFQAGGSDVTSAGFAGVLERVGLVARAVFSEVQGGVKAMVAAFKAGGNDVTSSGLAGFLESLGLVMRHVYDALAPLIAQGPAIGKLVAAFSPLGLVLAALTPVLPVLAESVSSLAVAVAGVLTGALVGLTPVITGVLTGAADLLTTITSSPGGVEALSAAILILSGSFVAYKVAVAGAAIATKAQAAAQALLSGSGAFATVVQASLWFVGLAKAQGLATAAQWLFNFAMTANPIGMIIAAISLLIGGIVLLVMNWGNVVGFLQGTWQGFVGWFTGVMDGFLSWWGGVWAGISAALAPAWAAVTSVVTAAWSAISTVVSTGINIVLTVVKAAWAVIATVFSTAWNVIKTVVAAGILIVVSIFTGRFGDIGNIVSAAWGKITGLFSGAFAKIVSIVGGAWEAIKASISSAIGTVATFISAGIARITGMWSAGWGMVKAFLSNAWAAITNAVAGGISNVLSFFQQLPGQIGGFLSGLPGQLLTMGTDMIQGLINGISSMGDAVMNAIGGVVSGAVDWAKGLLGIKSPSRVFRDQVGKMVSRGLAVGITADAKKAVDAVKKLSDQVAKAGVDGIKKESKRLREQRRKANEKIRAYNKAQAKKGGTKKDLLPTLSVADAEKQAKKNMKSVIAGQKAARKLVSAQAKSGKSIWARGRGKGTDRMLDSLTKRGNVRASASAAMRNMTLTDIAKAREVTAARLEKANEKLKDMVAMRGQFADKIRGELDLRVDPQADIGAKASFGTVASKVKSLAAKAKTFAGKLKALVKAGIPSGLVREIAGYGTLEGIAVANALLSGTGKQRKQLAADYSSLNHWSKEAGRHVTEQFFGIGINAQKGVIKGLESDDAKLKQAAKSLAKKLTKEVKKALGVHSPSTVFRDQVGRHLPTGIIAGIDKEQSALDARVSGMVNPSNATIKAGLGVSYEGANGERRSFTDADIRALADVLDSRPIKAELRVGNKPIAEANIAGRRELRLPPTSPRG